MQFYIVDVFSKTRYGGNQLAVVFPDGDLSQEEMLQITREFNFSETTFVFPSSGDGIYPVRIFTPARELPFAGHPVLGTAYIINKIRAEGPRETIHLDLEVGRIPVDFSNGPDFPRLETVPPKFGIVYEIPGIARTLNIDPEDIDRRFPVQTVSAGFPFILVPIKTLQSLRKARVISDEYENLFGPSAQEVFYAFAPEAREKENDVHTRMFGHGVGITEDPATGAAGYIA